MAAAHEIAVKTTQSNVTIRGRRWVMVPKRGGTRRLRAGAGPRGGASHAVVPGSEHRRAPPRVVPADVQALADAFDRGNFDAVQRTLARSNDLREHDPRVPAV